MFKRARIAASLPSKALYSLGIRSTRSLCLPDFLIIGAPKAGTTWLSANLDCHPQIYLAKNPDCSDPTEVRYFEDANFRRPLKYYSDLFLPGRDRIKGDKTPSYCYLPSYRIRFIRSIMPAVRIVFLMRNPVERAWSHAVMSLVRHSRRKIEEVPQSRFRTHFVRFKERGFYSKILDRWLRVFPAEQLYIGFFDQIVSDPLGLLRDACAHIRADTEVDWSGFPYRRVINRGQGRPIPDEYRPFLEEMYREEIARLDDRFGGVVSSWRHRSGAGPGLTKETSSPR